MRIRLTNRERNLMNAAMEAVDAFGLLDKDLNGLLEVERLALEGLIESLQPYCKAGKLPPIDAQPPAAGSGQ